MASSFFMPPSFFMVCLAMVSFFIVSLAMESFHDIVLSHLVLGEGGRRKREAERKRGNRYSERKAGAKGHGLVILFETGVESD
jgi:hypothetical protein